MRSVKLFLIVAGAILVTGTIMSQSAVYFCPDTTYYAFCYGGTNYDECALNKCQEAGGSNCQQIVDCKKKGFGAIAIGQTTDGAAVIGTGCGFPSLQGAKNEAVKQCTNYGGTGCTVKNTWNG